MKILIDIQGMQNLSANRGIGRYTEALVNAIIKNKENHEIYLLLNSLFDNTDEIKDKFKSILPLHHVIAFESIGPVDALNPNNFLNQKLSELIREKVIYDLSPDFLLISSLFEGAMDNTITSFGKFTKEISTAIILYDLIPLISPEKYISYKPSADWYYDKIDSLKKSNLLLSISESAKNEGIENLNFNEENIVNISSAVDRGVFVQQNISKETKEKFGINRKFLMHTSAYEERKNFEGLIEAFALLEEELRINYQLVLVCRLSDEQKSFLHNFAKKCGLKEKELILTGFASDSELIELYSSCHLFVFPSKHEGFGLPVLEAMNCGATVIGSNNSSIPEVIGLKEALFDPNDISSISKKIEEVLTDDNLYTNIRNNALTQIEKFSWDNTAKTTIAAMEKYSLNNSLCNKKQIKTSTSDLISKIVETISNDNVSDKYMMHLAACIDKNEKAVNKLKSYSDFGTTFKWRIEGPFDSSYSLALLNRETARAMDELGHFVVLHSTEGPGDFKPNQEFLNRNLDLKEMNDRIKKYSHKEVDVVSRNLYPPRVEDMEGKINLLHHYAWEESGFPQEWIATFNKHLTGMTCLSTHIEKTMIDNGINIPLTTSGCGVDHWERVVPDKNYLVDSNEFKFLHVSSCFPRKGADIMLEAYGRTFTSDDNVVLIIKTFKNPHNEIHKWLSENKKIFKSFPKVMIIEEDMSEERLKALYEQCDVLVAPSLAEGFGLPMAEAMLSGLPVITTNWGGQLDFCNDENSWLIDFTFERANTHFNLFNSVWAEPKVEDLATAMKDSFLMQKESLKEKSLLGRKKLLDNFKWIDVAGRAVEFAYDLQNNVQKSKKLKMAWISSWNTKCGIATYSDFLLEPMKDEFEEVVILANKSDDIIDKEYENNVIRCWTNRNDVSNDELNSVLDNLDIDCVFIQFNFSFFDLQSLGKIITKLSKKNKKIFITFHSVQDVKIVGFEASLGWITESLKLVDNIFVHNVSDLNTLKNFGLVSNVTLFPHGVLKREKLNTNMKKELHLEDKKVIGSYGFMLPHKGIKELIEAFALIRSAHKNTHLLLVNAIYPDPISKEYAKECKDKIIELKLEENITMVNDFLSDEESFQYLDCAALLVMPYKQTQESASGAVRYAISTRKPIVCTPISIFNDVEDIVHFSNNTSIDSLSEKIDELLSDNKVLESKNEILTKWIEEHDWRKISNRLNNILYKKRKIT